MTSVNDAVTPIKIEGYPFAKTERVVFELSNICNYASVHPQCPASLFKEKKVLRREVVRNVLELLGFHGYRGMVSFYGYSEPLIDPRLGLFIRMVKEVCPNARPTVTTNGFMLTQETLDELTAEGLAYARVSAYSKPEFDRISALKAAIPVSVRMMGGTKWRRRIENYADPKRGYNRPCHAPLVDIRITVEGKVGLCCVDYLSKHTFGDLRTESFDEIFFSGRLHALYGELVRGVRTLDLCQRCGVQRAPGFV
jgi:MoaA/NifB/PqqE/SkfB family radical SAM enzyme